MLTTKLSLSQPKYTVGLTININQIVTVSALTQLTGGTQRSDAD